MTLTIRPFRKEDSHEIYDMIVELAEYQRAKDQVRTSPESISEDGFGKSPLFEGLIAEDGRGILGMSLCYYRYSTWKGKRLYLEDLIVRKQYRGSGIGKELLTATINLAKEKGCSGIRWQVLNWNTPALELYKKLGASIDGENLNCDIDF